ncbi:class I SAM-dependent methyltransferase [Vreelandella malpeensis]|uniref:Class I SAM-dependent methyltransferase n=1 Tax=Vreelandella malpeensis TaxID=1172368 RepID=A0ABS8DV08_9GAMM|nr:class I SAM-dependent methyltransferase [Halomonas malpeensis]
MSLSRGLADHYHQALRDEEVLAQIKRHYPGGATSYQLAPLDQLHIGGLAASNRLFDHLDPIEHPYVLDIGAGLGGLVRLGASRGFTMTGLDITHRFGALSEGIKRLCTPHHDYAVVTGDARHLPFRRHSFDAVIFQHSLMNMPEPRAVLEQAYRVLRPGGKLILHELTRGDGVSLRYPVPWATCAEHSHLLSLETLLTQLKVCGFDQLQVENLSDAARAWRARQRDKERDVSAPVLSPHWVFGERFKAMSENLLENLTRRAIEVVEIRGRC